jgi:hypothetical protein
LESYLQYCHNQYLREREKVLVQKQSALYYVGGELMKRILFLLNAKKY